MYSFVIAGTTPQGIEKNCLYETDLGPQGQSLAQNPQDGSLDITINGHFDEIVSPQLTENGFSALMQPMMDVSPISDTRKNPDSNTDFLNMLFNPSFNDQFTSNNAPCVSSSGDMEITSLVHPAMEVFDTTRAINNARNSGQNLSEIGKIWPGNSLSATRLHFWHEIAFDSPENIFSRHDIRSCIEPAQVGPDQINAVDVSLTGEVKERLRHLKKNTLTCPCDSVFGDQTTCGQRYLCANTTEVFDQGLYLYLHKYQPSYPILHPATFRPEDTSELLLFVMCMIGISYLKTEDAATFIRLTYPTILNEAFTQFIFATTESRASTEILNHLVLAHHVLFMFISTGTVQQHGFFRPKKDENYNQLLPSHLETTVRWRAWTRVESTKNLIIGLLLHDSWLSDLFTISPIIRTDAISLSLPQEDTLYLAPTSKKWAQLSRDASHVTQTLDLSAHKFELPNLQGRFHALTLYGVLCTALLRVTADTHRLIRSSDLAPPEQHRYVPCNILRLDRRASISVPLLTEMIHLYDDTFRHSNPNCIVIWHSVCILLTVDIDILGRAAGRDGTESMAEARKALASWAQTASARRACLHAAQTFRILSHRKPADGTAFQSVRTLFMAALVLGLYILNSSALPPPGGTDDGNSFDLANDQVGWKVVRDEGLLSESSASQDMGRPDNEAVKFIRFGGPILIDRKIYHPGARHAQRIILEFASLLDEVGTHWMADYARLLYMIHDTMTN
ncbi:uncharacterized protein N7496_003268 [Penicillium cataractarum]|uniref:Xylanolytic transcriptional activator regulatory domain-containing protein n=1 Tax=Penicillium cataractarum TaxID=2100454 RepID=A0A9W9SLZ8_9EURO|nr:uncharacterized protein N7496_003268 [Penicillium cataractarum]KAJ5380840.1 hypothetical protein N7496_003268 [Penicillium cataractarum]